MKENLTEIVFILDESGSMMRSQQSVIDGFNEMLQSQKAECGEAVLTTVCFSNYHRCIHDNVDIRNVCELTEKDYHPHGMTALYDTLGKYINKIGERLSITPEENRPSKVLFIITTDGAENHSQEFDRETILQMIEHQQEVYSWEFIFMGANIDAFESARDIGISTHNAHQFTADDMGVKMCYQEISCLVSERRKPFKNFKQQ